MADAMAPCFTVIAACIFIVYNNNQQVGVPKAPGRVTKQAGMKAENSRSNRTANLRLAADIGGTFTDIAVFDDKTGRLTFGKALSTPDRLVNGISNGVGKADSNYASANLFLHGS